MKSSSKALASRLAGLETDSSRLTISQPAFRQAAFGYSVAILSVAVALGIKLILQHFGVGYPLSSSFLAAIAIAFWYGGTGPGVTSLVLSFVTFGYFVLPHEVDYQMVLSDGSTKPVYLAVNSRSQVPYFIYFALVALLMSWFSSSRRRAERSLTQARAELETKVEERTAKLTRANEELYAEIVDRKSAEERLRESEQNYRDLIEVSPDPIVVIDAKGNFVRANPAALTFAGYPEKEFIGKSVADTYVAEERALFWQRLDGLKTKGPSRFERRFLRKGGDIVLVEVSLSPMRGGYFQAVLRDITERRRAEEELRRSEEYLAEGQRISHTGSWVWNIVSGVWFWSPESLRIFGVDPAMCEFSLEMFLEKVHPDDRSLVERALSGAVYRRTAFERDYRALLPDGVTKHVHFLGRPVLNESGEFTEFIGVVMDITERKRAEEALRASEQVARGQVEALAQSLDILATATAPENLIGQMLSTIGRFTNAQSVALWLFDEPNGSLFLRAAAEGGNFAAADSEHPFIKDPQSWKNDPWLQEVLFTGVPAAVDDMEDNARVSSALRDYFRSKGTQKLLAIPTLVGGNVKGFVGIRHGDRPPYRPEEIELAQALSHQAMFAIQLDQFAEQSQLAAVLEERNRMARDIHDTLAQGFTGVIIQLEAAADAISCGNQKEADRHLYRAAGLARQSLNEARRSVHALRPDALERDNLWEALKRIIKSTTAGTALHTSCELRGKLPDLPSSWQENLLHIGQEALTNTLKYAHAQNFRTRLTCTARGVRLELRDDGAGFELTDRHDGWGLTGMHERVEQMNGQLEITSERGKGTRVAVALPLNKKPMR